MISVAAPRLRAALQCQDSANPCEQSSRAPLCESEHAEGGSVFEYGKRVQARGPTCRITQTGIKLRAAELKSGGKRQLGSLPSRKTEIPLAEPAPRAWYLIPMSLPL